MRKWYHNIVLTEDNCWHYVGKYDKDGYARITSRLDGLKRSRLAHRFTYMKFRGEIPQGHNLHHVCENKACVNPWHLEAITPSDHGKLHYSGPPRRKNEYSENP